jgi:hypothetical protein
LSNKGGVEIKSERKKERKVKKKKECVLEVKLLCKDHLETEANCVDGKRLRIVPSYWL